MRGPGRRAELARDCARPAWPPSPTGCLAARLPACLAGRRRRTRGAAPATGMTW